MLELIKTLNKYKFLTYKERLSEIKTAVCEDKPGTLGMLFITCLDEDDRESLMVEAVIYIQEKRRLSPRCLKKLQQMWIDPKIVRQQDKIFRASTEDCLESLRKKRKTKRI